MCNVCVCVCVYLRACYNAGKCFPEAYLSGANYNITIRQEACWSQLELSFNWTALIGLLHSEVELNVAAKSRCEVAKWDLCYQREVLAVFTPRRPDSYRVLLMTPVACVCLVVLVGLLSAHKHLLLKQIPALELRLKLIHWCKEPKL